RARRFRPRSRALAFTQRTRRRRHACLRRHCCAPVADRYGAETRGRRRFDRRPNLCAHRCARRVAECRSMTALLSLTSASVALGSRAVVTGVSLTTTSGEIIALLGPNGAGKTSLIRAALGLIPLSAGEARLGANDPRTLSPRERALRAAYLPQRPQSIWPISVEHLVALGRYAYGGAPDRLAPNDQAAVDAALKACA